jgi:hypothetical protein
MIRYPHLRQEHNAETGRSEWVYGDGRHKARIYAGKIDENLCQHLAREVIADNMLAIKKRYPIKHSIHDEVAIIVPDSEAEEALEFMQSIMRTPPVWWPELTVWSDGSFAQTYGAAK